MVIGLKTDTLLDHGKYRIERVLGHGGFGITYLVTDIGLDKQRAVKEFFPNNKTRHLLKAAKMIVEEFDGELPKDIDYLMKLPGVGRKAAKK